MQEIFKRLELKEEKFSIFEAATDQDMKHLWESVLEVDNSLVPEDTSKKHIENKPRILEFMNHCCRSRTYFFEIRKCQEARTGCTICKPPWSRPDVFSKLQPFPDSIPKANEDHYMPFCEIYSKDTSKKYRPSLLQKANVPTSTITTTIDSLGVNGMGFSPRAQYATNVRILVKCIECNRPRVLYSQYRLNPEEENLLKNFLETIDYTCGTTFYGISDLTKASPPLFRNDNNCSINNDELTCAISIEVPYFSSHLYPDVCFQCGDTEIFSPTPASEQPYCSECYATVKTKKKKGKGVKFKAKKRKAVKKSVA
ncbi:14884_t:CDS:2, partial [Racocetra persica]